MYANCEVFQAKYFTLWLTQCRNIIMLMPQSQNVSVSNAYERLCQIIYSANDWCVGGNKTYLDIANLYKPISVVRILLTLRYINSFLLLDVLSIRIIHLQFRGTLKNILKTKIFVFLLYFFYLSYLELENVRWSIRCIRNYSSQRNIDYIILSFNICKKICDLHS